MPAVVEVGEGYQDREPVPSGVDDGLILDTISNQSGDGRGSRNKGLDMNSTPQKDCSI